MRSMNIQERDKVEEEEEGLHEREIKREEKEMDTWKKILVCSDKKERGKDELVKVTWRNKTRGWKEMENMSDQR